MKAHITISNCETLSDPGPMPIHVYHRLYTYPPQAPPLGHAQQAASQWSISPKYSTQTHPATILPQTHNFDPVIVLVQLRAAIWVLATFIVQTKATIWVSTREHCLRLLYMIRYNLERRLHTSQEVRELVNDILYEQLPYIEEAIPREDIASSAVWPMTNMFPTKMGCREMHDI